MDSRTPVICDRCRAEGLAGDPAFSAIPDILAFDPVPLRAHANNWTAEHQRAFIGALALTGSVSAAARAIGRYSSGADRLRKAKGGRGFAEAWDAALELARDRELGRVYASLSELAEAQANRRLPGAPAGPGEYGPHVTAIYGDSYDPDEYLEDHEEIVEAMGNIRDKLLRARRMLLAELAEDAAKRAATRAWWRRSSAS